MKLAKAGPRRCAASPSGARTSGWAILASVAVLAVIHPAVGSSAEEEPRQWEALFFPFPIVGAPPQLEQQVQLFDSYFHGS